jgi:hypothetical protein
VPDVLPKTASSCPESGLTEKQWLYSSKTTTAVPAIGMGETACNAIDRASDTCNIYFK